MNDFDQWRKRIDEIDQQLVRLLNERSQCAVEIGHIKKQLNVPIDERAETPAGTDCLS